MMSSSSSIAVKTAFAAAQRGMAKNEKVERPTTKSEYELQFASVQAKGGWTDLKATTRNAFVVNWDSLTHGACVRIVPGPLFKRARNVFY